MINQEKINSLLEALYHPALKAIDPGLERVERFLAALGNPQHRIPPVIHVAGTNGKGSLIANLQAVFESAGLRAHRYISPHLVRFNERISLGGQEIENAPLWEYLTRVQRLAGEIPVTFFEATTAAAFLAFADHPADAVLLETGMGGRLDATNVLPAPALTAITPVALDHCEFLGDTLTAIAFEKAGILKPGVDCVVGRQSPEALAEIRRVALMRGAPVSVLGVDWRVQDGRYEQGDYTLEFTPALSGAHQFDNAATAIACARAWPGHRFSDAEIRRGVASARWPGRLQCLQEGEREVWLDGGHNPHGGQALGKWAETLTKKPLILICGMVQGKDAGGFLTPLSPHAEMLYAIEIPGEKSSQAAAGIAAAAHDAGIRAETAEGLQSALSLIQRQFPGPVRILICGSLYLAGSVLSTWQTKGKL